MPINSEYIKQFIKSTQMGAYGASLLKGKDDKIAADKAAVDMMRYELNKIEMKGQIVIGEGELDEAPMLYIGEKVGTQKGEEFDIAVDPLEGTNFTAKNLPNALSVMAITKKNNLFKAPETYMEKIAIGKGLPGNLVDLDFSIKKNINRLAEAKNVNIDKINVCLLDRPRHKKIIDELKKLKVNIKLISDGDVAGVLNVTDETKNTDMFLGIGGGPEGVLAAAALICQDCQMQTRLVINNEMEKKRCKEMGIFDLTKKYNIDEMIRGDVIFFATGVTDGDFVSGVKLIDDKFHSETYVSHRSNKKIEIIKNQLPR